MSILTTDDNRISVARFSKIPGLQGLPDIERPTASVAGSAASSAHSQTDSVIDRDEPCFITKSILYTHEQAHWINAERSDKRGSFDVVGVVPHRVIVVLNKSPNSRSISSMGWTSLTQISSCMIHPTLQIVNLYHVRHPNSNLF